MVKWEYTLFKQINVIKASLRNIIASNGNTHLDKYFLPHFDKKLTIKGIPSQFIYTVCVLHVLDCRIIFLMQTLWILHMLEHGDVIAMTVIFHVTDFNFKLGIQSFSHVGQEFYIFFKHYMCKF